MLFLSFEGFAQNPQTDDLKIILKNCETIYPNVIKNHSGVSLHTSANPFKQIAFLPLFLYQSTLSGQLSAGCEFYPSCSSFSIACISQCGLIKGICLTADRLTRCNGQGQVETQPYLVNHVTGKTFDLPSMYIFKK